MGKKNKWMWEEEQNGLISLYKCPVCEKVNKFDDSANGIQIKMDEGEMKIICPSCVKNLKEAFGISRLEARLKNVEERTSFSVNFILELSEFMKDQEAERK